MKMLERAARALLKQRQPWQRIPFEDVAAHFQSSLSEEARATIRSTREPDEEVIEAMRQCVKDFCHCDDACASGGTTCGWCEMLALKVFQAAIDKITEDRG